MVDSIKITALQDIGANIAYTTLVPVVNMAGVPTTQKSNLQNLGNLILNGAGGSYFPRAAQATLALSVANAAQPNITSVGTLGSLTVSGNITAGNINGGNIVVANYYYGDGGFLTNVASGSNYSNNDVANYLPTYTGIVGANRITSNALSGSNVEINANGASFIFGEGGALYWPAGPDLRVIETNIDGEFEIKSTTNVVISTDISNANLHFTFASDGAVYCPANAYFEGTRLNVGPGAGNIVLPTNPTLVITDTGLEFVQTALFNQSPNGSSDYAAYGADSDETQGFADLGFAGHNFDDPNYTITNPGDGYVLSQGYANGIGGALVLATGEYGNVPDIVFATGGFLANAEFARIDHANDVLHLTRAGSGIKFYDGTIQTTAGGGGGVGAALVNGDNSFVLDNDGNVVFEGDVAGQGINRGLVWDYGANVGGVNSEIRQDNNGITVRAWTENGGMGGSYAAPVNIVTNQDANAKTWTFGGDGNLTLPGNLNLVSGDIYSNAIAPAFNTGIIGINSGNANVIITLAAETFQGPVSGQVTISGVNPPIQANGDWWYQAVEVDQFQLFTDSSLTTPVDGSLWPGYVDGGTAVGAGIYSDLTMQGGNVSINSNESGWTFRNDGNLTLPGGTGYISSAANTITMYSDTAELNGILFYDTGVDVYAYSDFSIFADNGNTSYVWRFANTGSIIPPTLTTTRGDTSGGTITGYTLRIGNGSNEAIITTPDGDPEGIQSSQRLVINPGKGADGTGAEGGDIYLWAGRGGDTDGNGGDIKIRGGYGPGNGQGGYVRVEGGDSGGTGQAGYINLEGGVGSNTNGGYINLKGGYGYNGIGGNVSIEGGYGVPDGGNITIQGGQAGGGTGQGGNVTIGGGISAGGLSYYGNVFINCGAQQWQFNTDGEFLLGGGNSFVKSIPNNAGDLSGLSTLNLYPDNSIGDDRYLIVDPTGPNHIHIRAGGTQDASSALLFLGGEQAYTQIDDYAHEVKIGSYDSGNSAAYIWTFENDGNLTVPGNIVSAYASPAPSISGFSSVNTLFSVTTPVPYTTLIATAGARAFINDANLVAAGNFGALVSNGGSNTVPVWSDGTNWYIG